MAAFRVSGLLRFLSLVILASITTAADPPPRSCVDTGLTCIESCTGEPNGNYQWCGGCQYFIQCNQGITYYQPCPSDLYWHDDAKACVSASITCTECIIDTSPNGLTESTVSMATPIASLCESTGIDCLTHCDQTLNGIFQWCARCDYFLQCSGSTTYYQECQPGLQYDDSVRACVYESTTCVECYEPYTTTRVDPCASSPCLNSGTCTSGGSSFTCSCPDRYTGNRCETYVDPCSSGPCLNGATCLSDPIGIKCTCPDRYTGGLCETYVDPCSSVPCLNGATCSSDAVSMECTCPDRYTGELCQTYVDPCSSVPCLNGATCSSDAVSMECTCPDRYTGELCETYVDPCSSGPCLNGATCLSDPIGIKCTCPDRYTGGLCETYVDPCSSGPCLNGATCSSDATSMQCTCPDRYTGQLCETFTSLCDSFPCLNGGTCNDIAADKFSCTCPIAWTGVICESRNYYELLACGTSLEWANYSAVNGFTRFCYFWAPLNDTVGRDTECRHTITGIPLYDDYTGLLAAGGNFGCIVSQNYPDDLVATSALSCANNYQQDVSLGNYDESALLMVCLRYPYNGVPGRK